MIILGIDPGTRITGYGLVEQRRRKAVPIAYGTICPPAKDPMAERLGHILDEFEKILRKFNPDVLSIEKSFFAKNAATALKLGQCRGLCLAGAARFGLQVFEYSPKEIKQAVSGYGQADKAQVQRMIQILLGLTNLPSPDASDALAAALCHAHQARFTPAQRPQAVVVGGPS